MGPKLDVKYHWDHEQSQTMLATHSDHYRNSETYVGIKGVMGSRGIRGSKGFRESEGVMDSKGVAIPNDRGWGVSASEK